jgi:hypothetical protein
MESTVQGETNETNFPPGSLKARLSRVALSAFRGTIRFAAFHESVDRVTPEDSHVLVVWWGR